MRWWLAVCSVIGVTMSGAVRATAGPIDPPQGPVASTFKTLTEIEPRIAINEINTPGGASAQFRITEPGSYYLPGNVEGVPNKDGIEIASDNVSIDLMGFVLSGVPGAQTAIVQSGAVRDNIHISNGVITGWEGNGVFLFNGTHHTVRNLHVRANAGFGIHTGAGAALVESCTVSASGQTGISCLGPNVVIRHCFADANGSRGIVVNSNGALLGCEASDNGDDGIQTGFGSSVVSCTATGNAGDGIAVNNGCTVTACAAVLNGGAGFDVFAGTISGCTATNNTGDGIAVNTQSLVTGNTCSENGFLNGSGAGIRVSGRDNRIEGNNCLVNDVGVQVVVEGNLVARNSASGNGSDFSIVGGNDVGPIGSAATSTSPWANIKY